ncbi:MAG: response regulator transcription factor [Chloroflexi bacterium]|nr:response regulator transcription factor [Chloroflexota bacterium]
MPAIREGLIVSGTILLVEDDPDTARSLTRALESSGYRVTAVDTGNEARSIIEHMHPDLILLDLMLPDTDGLVLTTALKQLTNSPIIICSARQQQVDRVLGLKLGADDFVAKPFDLDELEARIEAVLRRASRVRETPPISPDQIRVDELLIAQSRGTVTLAGQIIHLTPTEYRLLVALASRPDEVLSREALGQLVWGYQDVGTGHLIDVHIGRLRLKLRRASRSGPVIATVRGKGYRIGSGRSLAVEGAEIEEPRHSGVAPRA